MIDRWVLKLVDRVGGWLQERRHIPLPIILRWTTRACTIGCFACVGASAAKFVVADYSTGSRFWDGLFLLAFALVWSSFPRDFRDKDALYTSHAKRWGDARLLTRYSLMAMAARSGSDELGNLPFFRTFFAVLSVVALLSLPFDVWLYEVRSFLYDLFIVLVTMWLYARCVVPRLPRYDEKTVDALPNGAGA